MMQFGLSIALSAVLVLSLALLLSFGSLGYKRQNKRNFSFLCEFPFEFVEGNDPFSKASSFFVISLAASSALCCTCCLWNSALLVYLPLGIALVLLGVFRAVGLVLLFRVPAYHFKFHSLLTVLYFCFSAFLSCLQAIFFLNMRSSDDPVPTIVLVVLEFVIALALCLLAINPKIASWTELESTGTADGGVEIHRPKPFVLAASEWTAIALELASSLIFLFGIAYFVLSL